MEICYHVKSQLQLSTKLFNCCCSCAIVLCNIYIQNVMSIQIIAYLRFWSSGNIGGRYSLRPSIPQADETWTTMGRGPRNINVSVDPKKFQNIKVHKTPYNSLHIMGQLAVK